MRRATQGHILYDDLEEFARKLDLFSSDEVAVIGRTRGHVLKIGTFAVICATAVAAQEREDADKALWGMSALFVESVDSALTSELAARLDERLSQPQQVVVAFRDRILALKKPSEINALT